jgi:hypothetical protein
MCVEYKGKPSYKIVMNVDGFYVKETDESMYHGEIQFPNRFYLEEDHAILVSETLNDIISTERDRRKFLSILGEY